MINFSVSRPGSTSKPMRACDKKSPKKNQEYSYSHMQSKISILIKRHYFLLVFTISGKGEREPGGNFMRRKRERERERERESWLSFDRSVSRLQLSNCCRSVDLL